MTPEKQKTPAARIRQGLPISAPGRDRKMPLTVPAPPAAEELIFAQELALGDVITRVRGTDIEVRWHILSDPVTCGHGHATVTAALDGQYGNQRDLTYPRDVYVTVASPARRFAKQKVNA